MFGVRAWVCPRHCGFSALTHIFLPCADSQLFSVPFLRYRLFRFLARDASSRGNAILIRYASAIAFVLPMLSEYRPTVLNATLWPMMMDFFCLNPAL